MRKIDLIKQKYKICDMNEWYNVNADLIITDPPFGIDYDRYQVSYDRDYTNIVEGYIEWQKDQYASKINDLIKVIHRNLKPNGQALVFTIYQRHFDLCKAIFNNNMFITSKFYWIRSFIPFCRNRPTPNVYEIYCISKTKKNKYNNKCNTEHCRIGEKNLASLFFKKVNTPKGMKKYITMLPLSLLQCLIEHYSDENDLIFDPLAGSGMVGICAYLLNRDFILGDINPKAKEVFIEMFKYYVKKKGSLSKRLLF